eukprot:752641-Hanusia_phi.AAC.3
MQVHEGLACCLAGPGLSGAAGRPVPGQRPDPTGAAEDFGGPGGRKLEKQELLMTCLQFVSGSYRQASKGATPVRQPTTSISLSGPARRPPQVWEAASCRGSDRRASS